MAKTGLRFLCLFRLQDASKVHLQSGKVARAAEAGKEKAGGLAHNHRNKTGAVGPSGCMAMGRARSD